MPVPFSIILGRLAGLVLALVSAGAASAAASGFDRLVVGAGAYHAEANLPGGLFGPAYPIGGEVAAMAFLPDGRLLAVSEERPSPLGPTRMALHEILADGSLRRLGAIATPPEYGTQSEYPGDLGVDRAGRVFLLSDGLLTGEQRLTELRPGDASTVSTRFLEPDISGLAPARGAGFLTLDGERCLRHLDADSGQLGAPLHCYGEELSGTSVRSADSDSAGRFYFTYAYVCSPPCGYVGRIDPASGELLLLEDVSDGIPAFPISRLAIERCAGAAGGCREPARGDELLTYSAGRLATARLPDGRSGPPVAVPEGIDQLLALPSGRLLATTSVPPHSGERIALNELLADGTLRQIGLLPPGDRSQQVLDMALDPRGRLYLLILDDVPPLASTRLVELDPATAAVKSSRPLRGWGIARAPDGLWLLDGVTLRQLDPDTLEQGPPVASLGAFGLLGNIETSASGRIYFKYEFVCSPPCVMLGTVDPVTGVAEPAPPALYEQTFNMVTFAIRSRCTDSATAACLQGSRFRAEVAYTAYDGAAGPARLTPARSADTAVFSFFDPENWELMVKVLDGCALSSHFWVYSSASTDVGFVMTITDTETGAQKIYQNPLGRTAITVTDNQAFPCSP